jgi:DNA-binding CsgD family transcriptional regulator
MVEYFHNINKSALQFSLSASERIKEICRPLQECLGISCFGYLRLYNDCRYLFFNNLTNDEFAKKYIEIKALDSQFIDGLRAAPLGGPYFYLLSTTTNNLQPIMSLYYEYDIWHGFILGYRMKEYCDIFTYAFNRKSNDKTQFFCQNSHLLVKFSNHFLNQAADFIDVNDRRRVAVFSQRFDFSYAEDQNKNKFLSIVKDGISLKNANGNLVHLSKQEAICLKFYTSNKTAKEIAQILDLSPRTIEYYINNIKEKAGIHYKTDLIKLTTKSYD